MAMVGPSHHLPVVSGILNRHLFVSAAVTVVAVVKGVTKSTFECCLFSLSVWPLPTP